MVGGALLAYLLLRARGEGLSAGLEPGPGRAEPAGGEGVLAQVLLALAVITVLARAVGWAFRRWLGQPAVMGEIVAGIVLGPSVLGVVWPEAHARVLPAEAAPYLGMIANVGVVLFLFLVGLELDWATLRKRTHAVVLVSHASILAPFLLGAGLALWMYPRYASADVRFTVFSLFMGISLSVTAFPVLARILIDRGVQHTQLGVLALACAAVDDVTAWTLLALLAGVADARLAEAGRTVVLLALYVAGMIALVRPLLARFAAREERVRGELSHGALAAVFAALLLSAVATEAIGVHALFGAFLLGALLPSSGRLARELVRRLEGVVLVLLLPAFFAFTGMRTRIGLLESGTDWLVCGAIFLVATAGKLGGTALAARLTGTGWRPAVALGLLMNTRGLMELIVLNLGLDLGVITPKVFTMLVLMALATTFLTSPALTLLLGRRGFESLAHADRVR
jgi:Kef-type K+ transport system membrane component KefB